MIKLSIIIVNYKTWEPLRKCLDSLQYIDRNDFTWEVIIVDNYSNDYKLGEFKVCYPEYTFLENEGNYGFAHGNNLGAKHARGEYLLFLNSDTVLNNASLVGMLNQAD